MPETPSGIRHRVGPTDISDPFVRREARRAFTWIGVATLIALLVWLSQSILVIFGGVVFAALVDGGARLLGRVLPIRRSWRVGIVLLLTTAFALWLFQFAGTQIAQQASELPATVQGQFNRGLAWLNRHGFEIHMGNLQDVLREGMGSIGQVTRAVGGILGGLTTLFLILVLGIYFALEPQLYRRGLAWLLPADRRIEFEVTSQKMGHALRRLLFGRVIGMTVEGTAAWILLEIYGVPMAALLGLITGLLAFLPNIGAPISGALMVLVGFSGGFDMGVYTILVYIGLHLVDGYIIVPMIARKSVDLPPALVLAAQLIMGVLFGMLGLVLADPLVAMLKVWLEREAKRHEREQNDMQNDDATSDASDPPGPVGEAEPV